MRAAKTLTIPAGTPIPASLYSFLNERLSVPANIATFSSPGVSYENSQRIYLMARDLEPRLDKLDGQPFARNMIAETLLHLNGLDDQAYLHTGDLDTASADILSLKTPLSFSIPYLGTVKVGFTLYSRSGAPSSPNDVKPLNVALELVSEGSEQALSVINPRRIAGFRFDNTNAPTSIDVRTVNVSDATDVAPGLVPAHHPSGISVIGITKTTGGAAFAPVPDSLISTLQGAPLTGQARVEMAALLSLYTASPDAEIRNAATSVLQNLANDPIGAPIHLQSSIAIGQLLQTAADANRIPKLPNPRDVDSDH